MLDFTVKEAIEVCSARLSGNFSPDALNISLGEIVIDSRKVNPGDVFVAIKGQNTDGYDYIDKAFELGASCCVTDRPAENARVPILVCDDVVEAMHLLARRHRRDLDLPVLSVVGSVGKTTTKEMISAVLSRQFSVLKTQKNLNNHLGVPMTVSTMTKEHTAAVVELGINGFNQMDQLAVTARPHIAVITNIGHAHLEFLRDTDGVFEEKSKVLNHLEGVKTAVLNYDDPYQQRIPCSIKKLTYAIDADADIKAFNIVSNGADSQSCDVSYKGEIFHLEIPAFGRHIVYAALAAVACGILMNIPTEEIAVGISNFQIVGRRLNVVNTGKYTLVDDCYNANPDSVKSALDSIKTLPGRKVFIFGDMLEMGDSGGSLHRAVGEYSKKSGVDVLVTVGPLSKFAAEGFDGITASFDNTSALLPHIGEYLKAGDVVLVKGSRGISLDAVSEKIKEL